MAAFAFGACGHTANRPLVAEPSGARARVERRVWRRGALLVARLDQRLGTDVSKPGELYSAHIVGGALPPGARLFGHVVTVEKGRGESPPRLVLSVDGLRAACGLRQIAARVTWTEGEEADRRPPGDPLRSAVIAGLFFGGVLLGPAGAMVGGTIGLGGGTAGHAAAQVVDARLPRDSRIVVELDAPLDLRCG